MKFSEIETFHKNDSEIETFHKNETLIRKKSNTGFIIALASRSVKLTKSPVGVQSQ